MRQKAIWLMFICGMVLFVAPPVPQRGMAAQTVTITSPEADLLIMDTTADRWVIFLKFDISAIAGETLSQATLSLYSFSWYNYTDGDCGSASCVDDADLRLWRVDNQTWSESLQADEFVNETRDTQTTVTDITTANPFGLGRIEMDVTDIVSVEHTAVNTYVSFRVEDPDYVLDYPNTGVISVSDGSGDNTYGIQDTSTPLYSGRSSYARETGGTFYDPWLELIVASPGPESEVGEDLTFSIQPADLIPSFPLAVNERDGGDVGTMIQYAGTDWARMLTNDGEDCGFRWGGSVDTGGVDLVFDSPGYWQNSSYLNYNVTAAYGAGAGTITLYDYDPGVATADSGASITGSHALTRANWNDGKLWIRVEGTMAADNALELYVDQMAINFTTIAKTYFTERIIGGTTMYDVASWDSLAPNTTLTITGIPTDYSLDHIEGGACDTSDTIAGSGQLILTNTSLGRYTIFLDVGQNIHEMHFAHAMPDGLGARTTWDEVRWFLNDSQVEHNDYLMFDGVYDLDIYDYYNQLIVDSETITLEDTDAFFQRYEIILPLYYVMFSSTDDYPWTLNITRNAITYQLTIPPRQGAETRLYGLATNVNYTLTFINPVTNEIIDTYDLEMPNYPISARINYKSDDDTVEVSVGSPPVSLQIAQVTPRVFSGAWLAEQWPNLIIIGMLATVLGVNIIKKERPRGSSKRGKSGGGSITSSYTKRR